MIVQSSTCVLLCVCVSTLFACLLPSSCAPSHRRSRTINHQTTNTQQNERVLRSQALHLQQQVNELNAKQVELLGQKQAMQVREGAGAQHQTALWVCYWATRTEATRTEACEGCVWDWRDDLLPYHAL